MNEVDILGIDLGTTNSAIAIWEADKGQAIVLHNQDGNRITPSVAMFDPQTRHPLSVNRHSPASPAPAWLAPHELAPLYSSRAVGRCRQRMEVILICFSGVP